MPRGGKRVKHKSILRDCLETFKHLNAIYSHAAAEADSDRLRKAFINIAVDKLELQAATFNLMHQMGLYRTRPAEDAQVQQVRQAYRQELEAIQGTVAKDTAARPGAERQPEFRT